MAKEHSFDITAKIDMQNFKNAINLVDREVSNRYDFKGTMYEVTFNEKAKTLVLVASSDNKLDALKDIVIAKLLKQNLSSKVLDELKVVAPLLNFNQPGYVLLLPSSCPNEIIDQS